MKYQVEDRFEIWKKVAEIVAIEDGIYVIIFENKNERIYLTENQIDLKDVKYFVRGNTTYKKDCEYPMTSKSNEPAICGTKSNGHSDRIDFRFLRKATTEEIEIFEIERIEFKWRYYARDIGEIEIGDIVKYQNIITEVTESNIENLKIAENIEMICFNSERFDKSEYR